MSGGSALFGVSITTLKKALAFGNDVVGGLEPRETAYWSLKMTTENRRLALSEDVSGALQLEQKEGHKLCSRSVPKGGARDRPATYLRGSRRFSPGSVVRFCAESTLTCQASLASRVTRHVNGWDAWTSWSPHPTCVSGTRPSMGQREQHSDGPSFCPDFRAQQSQSHATAPPCAAVRGWRQSLQTKFGE